METICPNGHRMDIAPSQAGMEMRCPTCQATFVVMAQGETARTYADGSNVNRPLEATRARGDTWWRYGNWDLDLLRQYRPVGELLILLGLLLALSSRGCDAVAERNVASARAQAQHAENEWYDEWQDRLDRLDEEEQALRERRDRTADDEDRLTEIAREKTRLAERREEDRRQMVGEWDNLDREARERATEHQVGGPWLEGAFMIGTLLLGVGLLTVGLAPESPGRWICLILLAIMLSSLYFGGDAWENATTAMRR